MVKNQDEPLVRDRETLRFITEGVRKLQRQRASVEEQQKVWNEVGNFFAPEIEEAMNYTGKLPSFRDCGGTKARKELLKQEAELIIYENLVMGYEQSEDFENCLRSFREAIRKRLREYTQQAQRESFHVDVKQRDTKTNENGKCVVVSGGKDITAQALNPNYMNEEPGEDMNAIMERHMGPYQSL